MLCFDIVESNSYKNQEDKGERKRAAGTPPTLVPHPL